MDQSLSSIVLPEDQFGCDHVFELNEELSKMIPKIVLVVGAADADNTKHSKEGNFPSLLIHYTSPLKSFEDPNDVSPGRRLVVPLHICVLQGSSL
ncbi:unnamed protein product [Vicia faba]|uniref:Uncharacterized protein n=1 Tax=Vicia faba TaxID=3906 RepID=A0AAV0Z9Y7_VICFA|nr:unnamed protein product [Vicia faba]